MVDDGLLYVANFSVLLILGMGGGCLKFNKFSGKYLIIYCHDHRVFM